MRSSLISNFAIRTVTILIALGLITLPTLTAQATPARSHTATIKRGGIVTLTYGPAGSWVRNFNPHGTGGAPGTAGLLYAPLLEFNPVKGGKVMYWLARKYAWGNHGHTLTFYLRPGLRWSDGKPLTSADALFSFNLAKKDKGFTFCNGCWSAGVTSVTAPNATTFVVHIGKLNSTLLYYIGVSYIVPAHHFAKSDPAKYTNANPVTSGPFELDSFSPQVFTFKRNPYWFQKGKPYVDGLRFPAYSSNDSANLAIINGDIDWAGTFIPNARQAYIAKDPQHNHFWFPSLGAPVALYLNNAKPPFNNLYVRRAISMAVDRTAIGKIAEDGYANPTNGAIIQPQFVKKWADPALLNAWPQTAEVSAAKAELAKAKDVDLSKTYNLNVVSGWTDWVTAVTMVQQELSQIGIHVNVQPLQFSAWLSAVQSGNYDMSIGWTDSGPNPFYTYRDAFWSQNTAPIGQTALTNWERYTNPQMDKLIAAFYATTKVSRQVALLKQMERLYVRDVPIVGLFYGPWWYEYNTKRFVGWPNSTHPYDQGSPWAAPSNLDVILHVHKR
jgi:peptide/nickel transport system substrate-binding protein